MDRIFYKTRAKVNLQGKWLVAALVSVILLIATGRDVVSFKVDGSSSSNGSFFNDQVVDRAASYVPFSGAFDFFESNLGPFIGLFIPFFLIALAAGLAFNAFILGPLSLGAYQFFRRNDLGEEQMDIQQFLWAFRSPSYGNIVRILFIRSVKTFLWSLLFIIPGIVKHYEYSMIPYLLTKDPGISLEEAFGRSRELTTDRKGSLFVLDLSFIGWYLLGSIPFGLGTAFVKAYETQTIAGIFNDWVGDTHPV